MTSASLSLGGLVERGEAGLAHYLERERPPSSPLEWLGMAVAHLPELNASARTADDLSGASRARAAAIRTALLDALAGELASAAALLHQARERLLDRHPDCAGSDASAEDYADLVVAAQLGSMRHAETMIGAYASFLGGAIEAAGGLADAERALAGSRRWERGGEASETDLRAGQLHTALTNALGGLLAYARIAAHGAAHSSE